MGSWPAHITVISHDFKSARFVDLHRSVLKYPPEAFTYIGVPLPPQSASDAIAGELKSGFGAWKSDLYGNGEELKGKREKRDAWGVQQPGWLEGLLRACQSDDKAVLEQLLAWEGGRDGNEAFPQLLPWEENRA